MLNEITVKEEVNVKRIDTEAIYAESMECLQYYISVTNVDKLPYPMNETLQEEALRVFIEWNLKIL